MRTKVNIKFSSGIKCHFPMKCRAISNLICNSCRDLNFVYMEHTMLHIDEFISGLTSISRLDFDTKSNVNIRFDPVNPFESFWNINCWWTISWQTVTDAAQQTTKVIEDARPVASSTVETISSADPLVIVGAAGALFLSYLVLPPVWSAISFSLRGYKGRRSINAVP